MVDPFAVFDNAVEETREEEVSQESCKHEKIYQEGKNTYCMDCCEMLIHISKQQEWGMGGPLQTQSRCYKRKKVETNISNILYFGIVGKPELTIELSSI